MTADRRTLVQQGPDVLLALSLQPRASRNQLILGGTHAEGLGPERITIRLTAPPVEGAANAACRTFLADLLGIAPSRITLVRGEKTRHKLLRIRHTDVASVAARLLSLK